MNANCAPLHRGVCPDESARAQTWGGGSGYDRASGGGVAPLVLLKGSVMKLYYSPGACSLASHITLAETGKPYAIERADNPGPRRRKAAAIFLAVSPRGAVPVLVLDDGEVLTEGVAIMQFVTDSLTPGKLPCRRNAGPGAVARGAETSSRPRCTRTYSPFFPRHRGGGERGAGGTAEQPPRAGRGAAGGWARLPAGRRVYPRRMPYLFTVTNWSKGVGHDLQAFPKLVALRARVAARPAVVAGHDGRRVAEVRRGLRG